jgi:SAM-dependent methyltransferase
MSETAISKILRDEGKMTHARYPVWENIIPFPPDGLLWSVGGSSLELFLVLGDAWAQLISRLCPEHATILDVGCGCGRTCRVLINNPRIRRYIGFDVIPENIDWCQNFLTAPWDGRAEFHHYDLYSREYNPNGAIQSSHFIFPCADGEADVIFAASVFTHLLEPDAVHYLRETARCLSSRGRAILSIHSDVGPGENYKGTETRIDIRRDYFSALAVGAGLQQVDFIEDLGGQQIFVFRRA